MSGSALPSSFCRGCKIHFIFRLACLLPVYHRLSTSRLGLASYVANPGSVTQRLPGRDLHPLVKYSMRCRFRQRWHTNGTFSVRTHNILNIYLATVPFMFYCVPFMLGNMCGTARRHGLSTLNNPTVLPGFYAAVVVCLFEHPFLFSCASLSGFKN
jgi:hypothetical protein